ncbi:hypothetical protein MPTK1_6g02320 [Marchantia polymorpha subsp. ruderalis]|uniref:Uncharacterized protein n=2 Tax=Marchantia polymorpha TaxID=3197 RepID=A0AAF6BMP6_MARPO|nr:hypothetical protein MARPO_0035s0017 [Marchantia polymorpha]BBN13280.1 hypothetical protein Mp_6g02320 [Marchantia polymorpha subsp. ruderalis]PTQ41207.1 hypothetical protein MARPO_0035s0017 [Marchantia polymorpha]PTQ41208.1 hypothetical protein MARPO_0035s0017 [Marchantia polymorpha]PTQ41209.1 hypothetical protein MARPO_0035s0017 [Marchantia polymorpha]|eukprot:PTQ41206.1 hypothetical protein MARPO_0035s0017 [Marchantia polymorpha]
MATVFCADRSKFEKSGSSRIGGVSEFPLVFCLPDCRRIVGQPTSDAILLAGKMMSSFFCFFSFFWGPNLVV